MQDCNKKCTKTRQTVIFVKFYSERKNLSWSRKLPVMLNSAVRSLSGARKYAEAHDADSDEVVRASFQSFPSQVEEKFVALQTSMSTVANRLDKLDHTIARHQMMKSLGENLTQGFNQMNNNNNLSQMLAAISTAMAASMGDLKAALVGAIGGAQSRGGGQFQQCAQHPSQPLQQQSNFSSRNNHMGHVSLSNPSHSRAECFEFKEIGHFARECPRRIRSEHLNWAQLEPQQ